MKVCLIGAIYDPIENDPRTSNELYWDYIRKVRQSGKNPYGNCSEWCDEMKKVFPELKKVRGWYRCAVWGKREHWWLEDSLGCIVDPTAHQFPTRGHTGLCEYEKHIEGSPEPTGKCMECGNYCYKGNPFCSDKCHESYIYFIGKQSF